MLLVEHLSKIFQINDDTPVQKILNPLLDENKINLFVKREDVNHPFLSGNKWHKLKYNLVAALEENYQTILTFGGAYSNHIYSVAYAGKVLNLKTIGLIRGEEHLPLNSTLKFANECGMELHFISRSDYRKKTSDEFLQSLKNKFGKFYLLPEGSSNNLAMKGCSEIIKTIKSEFNYLCCSCGTGNTFAGLVTGLKGEKKVLGFSALKGGELLNKDISRYLENFQFGNYSNWQLITDYHFGGYAKLNSELISFIKTLTEENNLPLEPIYTGKMFYGLLDMVRKKRFMKGDTIIALHTGGIQSINGF